MKKLTTFIVTLALIFTLTGCGNRSANISSTTGEIDTVSSQPETLSQAQYDELYALLTDSLNSSQEVKSMLEEMKTPLAELEELKPTLDKILENQKADSKAETVSSQAVAQNTPSNGNIKVKAWYNQKLVPITLQADASKSSCIQKPDILPYGDSTGQIRDLAFFIFDSTVQSIFLVDADFNHVKGLSFDVEDGITYCYYNLENGGGDYFFQIVLTNGTSYYIGVRY